MIGFIKDFNEILKSASYDINNRIYELESNPQNNISFASKYLHFHLPKIVFIMDFYSEKNARAEKNIKTEFEKYKDYIICNYDDPYKGYARHALRCLLIAQREKNKGKPSSPRAIDNLLMNRDKDAKEKES